MQWEWDREEAEYRLDGKGSLAESVDKKLPMSSSFLMLRKVAKDMTDIMRLESQVFDQCEVPKSIAKVKQAARRLCEAMELMPEAYRRETDNGNVQAGYLREPKP